MTTGIAGGLILLSAIEGNERIRTYPRPVAAADNIKLVGDNSIHPDNHYGTQALIDAIKAIATAYGEACDRGEFLLLQDEKHKSPLAPLWKRGENITMEKDER